MIYIASRETIIVNITKSKLIEVNKLKAWQKAVAVGSMVLAPLMISVPAFAATTTPPIFPLNLPVTGGITIPRGVTSIQVNVTDFDTALNIPPTDTFYFVIPGDTNSQDVVPEVGTLISGTTYSVPVPNYGTQKTVYVENQINGNTGGLGITIDGPLIDTLPEAPLAAALPVGMLVVWYVARRRKKAKSEVL